MGWFSWLFGNTVRTGDFRGNFAIGREVTQVFVQPSADGFGGIPSSPQLPFAPLQQAIVDGKPDISRLLRWNYQLVETLYGRASDLSQIIDWAESSDPQILLRLVEGEGGAGKTRLGAEVAKVLRSRGWASGFLGRTGPIVHAASKQGLLLIIDYPEEQPQRIEALIRDIGDHRQPGYRLRFLLLSRRSFDAWKETIAPIRDLCGQQPIAQLGPLPPDVARALIEEAIARLCELMHRPIPGDLSEIGIWLQRDEINRLSLYATAAAVHWVLAPTPTFGLDAPAILNELVERERSRINGTSEAAGLGPSALSRFLALATLTGALSADGTRRLAAPEFEITECGPTQIIDRLAELPWWDKDAQLIPALVPDLLAAGFSTLVLDDRSDMAPRWIGASIDYPVGAEFWQRLGRVIYDMDRLRFGGPSPVPYWLEQLVERNPAIAPAFHTLCFDQHVPYRLSGLAAKVGLALAETQEVATDDESLAIILTNASVDLSNAGRKQDALTAAQRAVEIRERHAAVNPAQFEPHLAMSLANLANRLGEAGQRNEALTAARRAVDIRERLVAGDPARFDPDLAGSLANLSVWLAEAGQRAAALDALQRAVGMYERLVAADPARFEADLGGTLNNLSNRLSENGQEVAALRVAQRAADIYARLAASNPAQFEPDFAMTLTNLASHLSVAGSGAAALTAAQRGVKIYERLAVANPARFESDLAASLNNISNRLSDAGQVTAALAAAQRAVEIRERLAAANPARFEPDLATSLTVLALRQGERGAGSIAADLILRVLAIWRRAAESAPESYYTRYMASLRRAPGILRAADRHEEAAIVENELAARSQS